MKPNRKGELIMPVFFTKELKNKNEKYINLDGAGIIYPYVANKKWNSVYRIDAVLKTKVNFIILEEAVKIMKKKYPYFFSVISIHGKKYVLKRAYSNNIIYKNAVMCKPFDIEGEETLLRIVYTDYTIGAEFFHGITDGHGAQIFFNELLKEYCNILFSQYSYDFPNENELPVNKELLKTDDIYDEIYNSGGKSVNRFLSKAYQFKDDNQKPLSAVSINVFSSALKAAAHKYGASITQYLCAVQIAAIIKNDSTSNKTIRISVPVDIRKFFDLKSARNASLYILIEIKPSTVKDFGSLIENIKKQFANKLTKTNMQNIAYSNVKCAKMKAYNILPVIMKKAVLNIGYTVFGENQFTSTITNLGIVNLDSTVKNIVSSAYYILGEEKTKPLNLAVTTYNSETKIIVSSTIDSNSFINTFCEILLYDNVLSEIINLNDTIKINDDYAAVC